MCNTQEPIEPAENASDKKWSDYDTALKLWLKEGADSPYNTPITTSKSIEEQKADRLKEKEVKQQEAIKLLPSAVKSYLDRVAFDEIAKSKGETGYSGYGSSQEENNAKAAKLYLSSKLSKKQLEAIQIYKKIAKLKSYQEYTSIAH